MGISEKKMQIVINNYFKQECDINTSIRGAFEKGFRIGVKKGQSAQPEIVRCKDCKYWTHIKRTDRYWCKTDDGLYDLNPSPDDFCSRAESQTL